jgi:N-hydroxyarylamine O-acetyltransferase
MKQFDINRNELSSRPRRHVGFGSVGGLVEPVPLTVDVESHHRGRRHRLVHLPRSGPLELWSLQARAPGDVAGESWISQYVFTLDPFESIDTQVANWYVATHPRSPFRSRLFVQRATPDGHLALDGRHLIETAPDGAVTERDLSDEAEVLRVLDERFGITAPESPQLRY